MTSSMARDTHEEWKVGTAKKERLESLEKTRLWLTVAEPFFNTEGKVQALRENSCYLRGCENGSKGNGLFILRGVMVTVWASNQSKLLLLGIISSQEKGLECSWSCMWVHLPTWSISQVSGACSGSGLSQKLEIPASYLCFRRDKWTSGDIRGFL